MLFLNRHRELSALDGVLSRPDGGLIVLSGRRRVGKTRLLLEWVKRSGGLYCVADESTAALQRRHLAEAISRRFPGFADVEYRDWRTLLARFASEAGRVRFRGPIVLDELPYLVGSSPELPSVLQQWVDHDAREAGLVVALAGSSQRMMQGLVLDAGAPLFGRSHATLTIEPLAPHWLPKAFAGLRGFERLVAWTLWGGVPRYWELASSLSGPMVRRADALVLDPMGPLHLEPDRLLLEETPSAAELRPLLEAIGGGAHRASEIAGRIGKPVTSLSRALERLQGLGLATREVPFGVPSKDTKRSLYRLVDPFLRMWFRVVAPSRATLAVASSKERAKLLLTHLPSLTATAMEELARRAVPTLGDWAPAGRWWQGSSPEWDVVSRGSDGASMLVGEVKAWVKPATTSAIRAEAQRLAARPLPELGDPPSKVERVLFVPGLAKGVKSSFEGVRVVTLDALFAAP